MYAKRLTVLIHLCLCVCVFGWVLNQQPVIQIRLHWCIRTTHLMLPRFRLTKCSMNSPLALCFTPVVPQMAPVMLYVLVLHTIICTSRNITTLFFKKNVLFPAVVSWDFITVCLMYLELMSSVFNPSLARSPYLAHLVLILRFFLFGEAWTDVPHACASLYG